MWRKDNIKSKKLLMTMAVDKLDNKRNEVNKDRMKELEKKYKKDE